MYWGDWLIRLYRFQVYSSMIHHLYIISCAHPPKSNHPPSPCIWLSVLLSGSVGVCLFFSSVHLLLSVLYPIYEWNHMVLSIFLFDLFLLAWYSQDPSMLSQMAVFHLFLWLSSIPLYICTTSPLSNHLLKDTFLRVSDQCLALFTST